MDYRRHRGENDVAASLMSAQGGETPLEVQCCDNGFDENLSLLKVKVRSCVVGVVEAQWEEVREKEQERAQIYCSRWCGGESKPQEENAVMGLVCACAR